MKNQNCKAVPKKKLLKMMVRQMTALRPVRMMMKYSMPRRSKKRRWKKKQRLTKSQKRFNTSARQSLSQKLAQRNRPKHMRSLITCSNCLSNREP